MAADDTDFGDLDKYIQPLPIWDGDQWLGLGFGQVETKQGLFWEIGLVFADAEYGRRVFDAITVWNDRQQIDRDNRIGFSLIIESYGDYTAYIYPTLSGVACAQPVRTAMLAKPFPNPPGSHFRNFLAGYNGKPVRLTASAVSSGEIVQVPDIVPVWKAGLKIKERGALTERDREYQHGRQIIEMA